MEPPHVISRISRNLLWNCQASTLQQDLACFRGPCGYADGTSPPHKVAAPQANDHPTPSQQTNTNIMILSRFPLTPKALNSGPDPLDPFLRARPTKKKGIGCSAIGASPRFFMDLKAFAAEVLGRILSVGVRVEGVGFRI